MPSSPRKTLPGSYHHLPGKEKLLITLRQRFFENICPAREGGETMIYLISYIYI